MILVEYPPSYSGVKQRRITVGNEQTRTYFWCLVNDPNYLSLSKKKKKKRRKNDEYALFIWGHINFD